MLDIQTLFRSAELSKLVKVCSPNEKMETSSESMLRFWLASTLSIGKSLSGEKNSTDSRNLRSLCIEIDSSVDQPKSKLSLKMTQELRQLGWLRYKERKNEILTPLYSWQQLLPLQSIKSNLTSTSIRSYSDRQTLDVQCKYIGSQKQCSAALTQALKVAQTNLIEWTQAYQMKTLIPTGMITSVSSGHCFNVFSFVFVNVDHYFLDWLERQSDFLIDLVFPSLYKSAVDLGQLAKTQGNLYEDVWSVVKFNRLSKIRKMYEFNPSIAWTEVSTNINLKWLIRDSQTYFLPSVDSYLPEMDAILVSSELINEIRSFFSDLKPLYAEMYSLALLEVNYQSYYLIILARRPSLNQRDRNQNTSYTWDEDHLKQFRDFIREVKHSDLGQAFFFQCLSKEPLLYLGLESSLVPQMKPYEIMRLLRADSTGQSEKKLALLSPFLSKTQEEAEVCCFQMPKPKFYRHEEFALLLYPQRLNRIKQWFDESFICLSPQALDDES